jgi:hypothetical protein
MPLRSIRQEPGVEEQLKALGIGYERFDDLMGYVSEVLSQHPEMFPVIVGTRISICRTNEFAGGSFRDIPSLAIYYHFDEQMVQIISIESSHLESYEIR